MGAPSGKEFSPKLYRAEREVSNAKDVGVAWVNAAMVVMSYQFVNGLLFTLAGMLAAQRRRAEKAESC